MRLCHNVNVTEPYIMWSSRMPVSVYICESKTHLSSHTHTHTHLRPCLRKNKFNMTHSPLSDQQDPAEPCSLNNNLPTQSGATVCSFVYLCVGLFVCVIYFLGLSFGAVDLRLAAGSNSLIMLTCIYFNLCCSKNSPSMIFTNSLYTHLPHDCLSFCLF